MLVNLLLGAHHQLLQLWDYPSLDHFKIAMQAVPLAALNGSVMSAFKPSSLSPPSADLAQTFGKMASNSAVYEISATAPAAPAMGHLAELEEDKCSSAHGEEEDEEVSYQGPSYYPSLQEVQGSAVSSPSPIMPASPKNYTGNLTPVSASSKDGSSSSSTSSEVLSAMEDEVCEPALPPHLAAAGMCIPSCADGLAADRNSMSGTHVKHWTYEDQFKQVIILWILTHARTRTYMHTHTRARTHTHTHTHTHTRNVLFVVVYVRFHLDEFVHEVSVNSHGRSERNSVFVTRL